MFRIVFKRLPVILQIVEYLPKDYGIPLLPMQIVHELLTLVPPIQKLLTRLTVCIKLFVTNVYITEYPSIYNLKANKIVR